MPSYRWQARVLASQVTDLGTIVLRRGSSVAGWVETEEGAPPSKSCRVKLSPERVAGTRDDRLGALDLETSVNENGFFQLEGIRAGPYVLTVTQPGFAPTQLPHVHVQPDAAWETPKPLILSRPVTLEVLVDPPEDPKGRPWRVEVFRKSGGSEHFRGEVSVDGRWLQEQLAAGTYRLFLTDAAGSRWLAQDVDVTPEQQQVHLRPAVVRIQGRVLFGSDPVSATVWFGGRSGSQRVRLVADQHGVFEGSLPRAGKWPLELALEDPTNVFALDPIEIKLPASGGMAEVEIVVPRTVLKGEVVDGVGRRAAGARVAVTSLDHKSASAKTQTDEAGKFVVRGLRAGRVAAQAEEGERVSDWVETELNERDETNVLLVLRQSWTLRGRVISPLGPLPGAQVIAWPEMGEVPVANTSTATTDPDGDFDLLLPPGSRAANIIVLPPRFALRFLKVRVEPSRTLEIALGDGGGTLVVELPTAYDGPTPQMAHGGVFVPLPMLRLWSRLKGVPQADPDRLVLPDLESGEYSLCVGQQALIALRRGTSLEQYCSTGSLPPSGELVLRLRKPDRD